MLERNMKTSPCFAKFLKYWHFTTLLFKFNICKTLYNAYKNVKFDLLLLSVILNFIQLEASNYGSAENTAKLSYNDLDPPDAIGLYRTINL